MAINIEPSHKGRLHRKLGIAAGKKIPLSRLMKAKQSKDAAEREEANFAVNARHWGRGGK